MSACTQITPKFGKTNQDDIWDFVCFFITHGITGNINQWKVDWLTRPEYAIIIIFTSAMDCDI